MTDVSVDLDRAAVKNAETQQVRKRTSRRNRPETPDRRVQRTKTSLHNALIGLSREKPYPSIAVKEILDRANVGKSTFYTHFRDKDDLLESGIREVLGSVQDQPRVGSALNQILAFSLPLLRHIDEHRRDAGPKMKHEGRVVMHGQLQEVLTALMSDQLVMSGCRRQSAPQIPTELLARHIAATFVLVLNWWVDTNAALKPEEVDARFRALVTPILTAP
jgi:AcrR family transcriptional regulator